MNRDITHQKKARGLLAESERKYRALMEALNEGVWVIDADAVTTFVNPRMAEMLGYTAGEMLGRHLFAFMDERGIEVAKKLIEKRRKGIKEQHDFEFIRKNGSRIYVSLETAPLYDEAGNYAGAIAGVDDITERRKMEKELLKTASIVQSTDDAIIGKTPEGIIESWNPGAEKVYGYTEEEVKGKPISILIPEGSRDETAEILEKIKRGERVEHYETQRRLKDGSIITVSLTVSPIRDSAGAIIGASSIARDITPRKKAEEERERLIAELRDAIAKVKTLSGLLPICASCKKVRDDRGYWTQIESYVRDHSEAEFSHGLCPDCVRKLYPEEADQILAGAEPRGRKEEASGE